jgi:spore maturation protein CgeB
LKIIYSFNKTGFEADYWQREIAAASCEEVRFFPFNHQSYLDPARYVRAQLLDHLYYQRDAGLARMYADLKRLMSETGADVLLVDNCPPYHPDFLVGLDIYKTLRVCDGPAAAYDRDFAYLHAYDHVLYHSPAYSRDFSMPEKLRFCGAKRYDFWPLAVFDAFCEPNASEEEIFASKRDLDVIFVGSLYVDKMPLLARVKKHLGKRFRVHGMANWKKNAYYNVKFGFPGWVTPLRFEDYVPLYRRAKLGINSHLRGKYTVGSYRLFDLPANGVMQLSDGGEYLSAFFEPGREIESYDDADELITKIDYALTHPKHQEEIARQGYRRAMSSHRIGHRLRELASLLAPR